MSRHTRRFLLLAFYLSSLLGAVWMTWFLTRNFTGLGPVPERATFSRRLPADPSGVPDLYRFFYQTCRQTSGEPDPLAGEGLLRGEGLSRGVFRVTIEPGMPIAPWVWENPDFMRFESRESVPPDAFVRSLSEAVEKSPHKSVLVVVWGWKDRFQSAAMKTAYLSYVLDIDTPVVMFDWPGNQGNSPRGYVASREMASRCGPDLAEALREIVQTPGVERVWVIGSSLGCQTICDAFTVLNADPEFGDESPEIDHVVLCAPDVSAREFDERFAAEVKALSRHLTAYVSSNDRALLLSEWINRGPRLGRTPVAEPDPGPPAPDQLDEAIDLLELKASHLPGLALIDATPVNRTRNLHHYFTDSPEFFDDLYRHLLQPENWISRRLYPARGNGDFWILWRE